ncbi:DUF3068 domain-containing protein [Streptomyces sp. NPDC054933]
MHGRRIVAFLALGLGVFLAALGPLLRWYVLPSVQLAPYDQDFTDISTGTGHYLDQSTGRLAWGQITVTRHTLGDAGAGRSVGKAVWDISTRVDTPRTSKLADARQAFSLSVHRWVFDRHTIRSRTCCGGDTGAGADGYLKYPFSAGHRSYQVWDGTAGKAYRADFTGTRTLYGRSFNQYTMRVPATRIGTMRVPPSVVGLKPGADPVTVEEWYSNPEAVNLVDPLTGAPAGGSSHQIITLRLPGSPRTAATALDVELRSTPETEKALVDAFKAKHDGLALLTGPVPYVLLGVGAIGAAVGGVLLRRHKAVQQAPLATGPLPVGGAAR